MYFLCRHKSIWFFTLTENQRSNNNYPNPRIRYIYLLKRFQFVYIGPLWIISFCRRYRSIIIHQSWTCQPICSMGIQFLLRYRCEKMICEHMGRGIIAHCSGCNHKGQHYHTLDNTSSVSSVAGEPSNSLKNSLKLDKEQIGCAVEISRFKIFALL